MEVRSAWNIKWLSIDDVFRCNECMKVKILVHRKKSKKPSTKQLGHELLTQALRSITIYEPWDTYLLVTGLFLQGFLAFRCPTQGLHWQPKAIDLVDAYVWELAQSPKQHHPVQLPLPELPWEHAALCPWTLPSRRRGCTYQSMRKPSMSKQNAFVQEAESTNNTCRRCHSTLSTWTCKALLQHLFFQVSRPPQTCRTASASQLCSNTFSDAASGLVPNAPGGFGPCRWCFYHRQAALIRKMVRFQPNSRCAFAAKWPVWKGNVSVWPQASAPHGFFHGSSNHPALEGGPSQFVAKELSVPVLVCLTSPRPFSKWLTTYQSPSRAIGRLAHVSLGVKFPCLSLPWCWVAQHIADSGDNPVGSCSKLPPTTQRTTYHQGPQLDRGTVSWSTQPRKLLRVHAAICPKHYPSKSRTSPDSDRKARCGWLEWHTQSLVAPGVEVASPLLSVENAALERLWQPLVAEVASADPSACLPQGSKFDQRLRLTQTHIPTPLVTGVKWMKSKLENTSQSTYDCVSYGKDKPQSIQSIS